MLEKNNPTHEFLIIGSGLSAWVIAHTLFFNNISFKVIGNPALSSCSNVAAGIWNPIVFKRFTKSWLADELINELILFYEKTELITKKKYLTKRQILKLFYEEQEKNLWIKKQKLELENFLNKTIINSKSINLNDAILTNELGVVENCGNLNVEEFIIASKTFFNTYYKEEIFNYSDVQVNLNSISYKEENYLNVIFAEGYLVKNNPYFNFIPLKPAKGEIIEIEHNTLNLKNYILNKDGFIFNSANQIFKVGATYNWSDLNDTPTENGKNELIKKISLLTTNNYKIINHKAGVRPSSSDRRPIIGKHPKYKNLWVFNGLGTKGVMLAPYFAKQLINFYLKKEMLNLEVDVNRFYNLYNCD